MNETRALASAVAATDGLNAQPASLLANTGSLGSRAASPAFVLAQAFAALAFAWLGVIRVRLVGLAQPLRNAISAALVSSG